MKGIAHFVAGVCAASFIPGVVESAAPLMALGGAAGLLPDTLDFKLARYFERRHDEIELGENPQALDPQAVADRMAAQMNEALASGEPRVVQLHTLRLGADLWRRYTVQFAPHEGEVVVRVGPVVNTSQMMYPGSEWQGVSEGRAKVNGRIQHTYDAEITIDIFSGPSFRFEKAPVSPSPVGGTSIRVTFLPWHRRWSHSLTLAAGLGALIGIAFGRQAGAVAAAGMAVHILEDQLGYMGSNLFWPFTRRRRSGLRLIRSGEALPNLAAVWVALMLTLWNLDRFSAEPQLDSVRFLLLTVLFPLLLVVLAYGWQQWRGRPDRHPAQVQAQVDMLDEGQEVQV